MSNLIPFGQGQVPAHFAAIPAEDSNIATKLTIPALSFRGKAWRIVLDDNETLITNKEGEPSTTVSVIILDQIKKRSRSFYEGQYVAGENKAPKCSSMDGVTPDKDIKEPVASACASCPNSVKGSKLTAQGKPTTLCAPNKRIAVIPATKLNFTALLLRLAQTSMWDKTTENEEWRTWDQYMDYLRASGATNTAQVVTKIKFDHRVEYPKLLFKAERWCTPEEWAVVGERWKSEEVKNLLLGKQAGAVETDDDEGEDFGTTVAPVAQPVTAPAQAAAPAPARARKPRSEPAAVAPVPAPAPAPAAAPVVAEDDDEGEGWGETPAAAPAPAPAPQPAPAPAPAPVQPAAATSNAGLSSLLGAWDD